MPTLEERFKQLALAFEQGQLKAVKDDEMMPSSLLKLSLDQLPVWQSRHLSPWSLIYNPLRALRPLL
ncbi:MAG: hypothetical protein KAG28_05865 [Cocleimonas sp.]|nr:hypothetical protein [Cocleimonas sp.]